MPRTMSSKSGWLVSLGVGVYAAAGLGYINHAAHESDWGPRVMYVAFGLYAAMGALRLGGRRSDPTAVSGRGSSIIIVVAALFPLLARPDGEIFWEGGTWVAAAGAILGFLSALSLGRSFALAPAVRGIVSTGPYALIRHPMAVAFVIVAAGFLSIHFNPWNAAILGTAVALAFVAVVLEERLLFGDRDYQDYAARTRWRFVPGLI